MIIDSHCHYFPAISATATERLVGGLGWGLRTMGKQATRNNLVKGIQDICLDPDGNKLLELMDKAGIDCTVICNADNIDNPVLTIETAQSLNRKMADLANRFPKQIIALAGVDPRRKEAPDMLKQCFEEFGLKGLKYHPDHGYDPVGEDSYRLLEIVEQHKAILLSHTGPLMPPFRVHFADPMRLADIGVDFPNIRVIAAHMGQVNWRPWASLATHQPNLYGDLAMWDALAFGHYDLFCRELRDLIDYVGVGKVLFGTDNPIFQIIRGTKDWIDLIKRLPDGAPSRIKFFQDEVDAILGGNAAHVFGLEIKE